MDFKNFYFISNSAGVVTSYDVETIPQNSNNIYFNFCGNYADTAIVKLLIVQANKVALTARIMTLTSEIYNDDPLLRIYRYRLRQDDTKICPDATGDYKISFTVTDDGDTIVTTEVLTLTIAQSLTAAYSSTPVDTIDAIAAQQNQNTADLIDLQNEVNKLVNTGDGSLDALQARIGVDDTVYNTLKERLDSENADLKTYADNAANTAIANLVDSAPEALNTLSEISAALEDDANYAATITNALSLKANTSDVNTALDLKESIVDNDTKLALKESITDNNTKLAAKADITYVDNQIASVGDGSPKGTYATLVDLETAHPTGTSGIYVVTADGHWYYWNSTAWTDGGTYQATEIGAKTVTDTKIDIPTFERLAKGVVTGDKISWEIGTLTLGEESVANNRIRTGYIKANNTYFTLTDFTAHKIYIAKYSDDLSYVEPIASQKAGSTVESGYVRIVIVPDDDEEITAGNVSGIGALLEINDIADNSITTNQYANESIIDSKININTYERLLKGVAYGNLLTWELGSLTVGVDTVSTTRIRTGFIRANNTFLTLTDFTNCKIYIAKYADDYSYISPITFATSGSTVVSGYVRILIAYQNDSEIDAGNVDTLGALLKIDDNLSLFSNLNLGMFGILTGLYEPVDFDFNLGKVTLPAAKNLLYKNIYLQSADLGGAETVLDMPTGYNTFSLNFNLLTKEFLLRAYTGAAEQPYKFENISDNEIQLAFFWKTSQVVTALFDYTVNGQRPFVTHEDLENLELLPDYMIADIKAVNNAVSEINTYDKLCFGFITDIHDHNDHIKGFVDMAKYGQCDFLVMNGDFSYEDNIDEDIEILNGVSKLCRDVKEPVFISRGNHDNLNDRSITDDTWYSRMIKPFRQNNIIVNPVEPDGGYYYQDFTEYKVRVIITNGAQRPDNNNGWTTTQLQWIGDTALDLSSKGEDKANWQVIVFGHQNTRSSYSFDSVATLGTELESILEAFATGSTYTTTGITLDFTTQGAMTLIAYVFGHGHYDIMEKPADLSFTMISTLSSKPQFVNPVPSEATISYERTEGTNTEYAWDIFVIDLANKTITTKRCGAGTDRSISY